MFFGTFELAPYLKEFRPEHSLSSLSNLWLGGHALRAETDRSIHPGPPREQHMCWFCHSGHVEDKQHILFHCSIIAFQRSTLFILAVPSTKGTLGSFLAQAGQLGLIAHRIHLCFQTSQCTSVGPFGTQSNIRILHSEDKHPVPNKSHIDV